MQIWVCLTMAMALANASPDTLVICPPEFASALQPWVEYRQRQGHRLAVEPPRGTSYAIRQQIRDAAKSGTLRHVVLIGDAVGTPAEAARLVPTDYVRAKVNVLFGSEPEIASDNTYADLDGDGLPDLSLGRMPVDTPAELTAYIRRVRQYESPRSVGPWQRRINFVAGVGGFGQVVDRLIEQSTKQMITELIPAAYRTSMTYGSWSSPYCPHPYRFSDTAIGRFNEGCLFWCYIGHGSRHRLDRVMLPDGRADILDCEMVERLAARSGSPIAIFLACYTGAIDDERDCLAEDMLRQEGGPVAVISSTRVAMPYAMSLMSLGMMEEYFHGDVDTLGELVLKSKQQMVREPDQPSDFRTMIEAMGKMFSPQPGLLRQERLEHVHLMHLLGDPLLRLKRPENIELSTADHVVAGASLVVEGRAAFDGTLTVELCYARDRFRKRPPRRKEYDPAPQALEAYEAVYRDAHDLTCVQKTIDVRAGHFTISVPVPIDASGDCHTRVMLQSPERFAVGAQAVQVQRLRVGQRTSDASKD